MYHVVRHGCFSVLSSSSLLLLLLLSWFSCAPAASKAAWPALVELPGAPHQSF
jgi:hypothetical protein